MSTLVDHRFSTSFSLSRIDLKVVKNDPAFKMIREFLELVHST